MINIEERERERKKKKKKRIVMAAIDLYKDREFSPIRTIDNWIKSIVYITVQY